MDDFDVCVWQDDQVRVRFYICSLSFVVHPFDMLMHLPGNQKFHRKSSRTERTRNSELHLELHWNKRTMKVNWSKGRLQKKKCWALLYFLEFICILNKRLERALNRGSCGAKLSPASAARALIARSPQCPFHKRCLRPWSLYSCSAKVLSYTNIEHTTRESKTKISTWTIFRVKDQSIAKAYPFSIQNLIKIGLFKARLGTLTNFDLRFSVPFYLCQAL